MRTPLPIQAIRRGLCAALLFALPAAHALSRVVIRDGNDILCDRVERIGDRIRIYTSENNFMEIAASRIESIEELPPEPAALPAPATAKNTKPAELTKADLREMLAEAGGRHDVDVDLLASIVHAESGGDPRALSRAGARGLMQLMPGTANEVGVKDAFDPGENIHGGTAYIDALLTRYNGNLSLALAAYNAGPAAVDRYHGIPPYRETRTYVARVIHEFNCRIDERNRLKIPQPKTSLAAK